MADMDYILHSKMSILDQQVLTSFDWEFMIDFQNYVGYHPDLETIKVRTLDVTGLKAALGTTVMEIVMRGFKLIQGGYTQTKPDNVSINMQDFEDQSIKAWFLDWQNKMDSLSTHKAYRRSDLMVDFYFWRLDSSLRRVWQYHYINCLPDPSTTYEETTSSQDKQPLGKSTLVLNAEYMIPTPLNIAS